MAKAKLKGAKEKKFTLTLNASEAQSLVKYIGMERWPGGPEHSMRLSDIWTVLDAALSENAVAYPTNEEFDAE